MFFSLVAFSSVFIHSTHSMINSPPPKKNSSLGCIFPAGTSLIDLFSCKQKRDNKELDILISRTINRKFTFLFGLAPHESLNTIEEGELQCYRAKTITQAMQSLKQFYFESDQDRESVVRVKLEQTLKELIGAHAAELYTIYYSQEAATNDAALTMAKKVQSKIELKVLKAIDTSKEGALIQFLGQRLEAKVKTIAQKK